MKRKHLMAAGIALLLLAGMAAMSLFASGASGDPTVTLDARAKEFTFQNVTPYTGNTYPNLFADADFTGMMPGDRAGESIAVEAKNLSGGYADIFLSVEPLNSDITSAEKADFDTLMSKAALTVEWYDRTGTTRQGTLTGTGRVNLGKFREGDKIVIKVALSLPLDAGNDLQGLKAEVGWLFQAEVYPDPGIGGGGGGGGGGGSSSGIGGGSGTGVTVPDRPQLETEIHYGYIVGREDGLVHPEAPITRAETATILFRLLTDDSRAAFWAQSNPYYDVYEEQWFNNAISTLSNVGILRGYPDNTFRPNAFITRAEFAVMLSRFYDVMEETEGRRFTDVAGHWAEPEIYQAAARELIEGYPEGDFRPNQLIDRAEAMTMINRLVGRQPRKEHLLRNMIQWPDNMDTTRWYYAQVQEATNGHDYTRANDANGSFEIWQSLAPIRDWAALEQSWSDAYSAGTVGEVITSRNAAYSR